ncbi:hypothetical protein B0I72DRAFT_148718 [Yarrowia lipolytica]|uniref:Uncharacterized protein n=1 Tax=Yarrowia lipolytica TaxID=4952 RepID=A0A371C6A1_YARLL|nr:hypothetical protein B0I71DRAFT_153016 [Yarrowia lipolytica]RDW30319.1 hypothetical protein B0I72DRAFT_148718 [Yarrowia lipolytica]RDW36955.1 hypothetical protein B0I73DRAFT_149583 [Yarrowia lipolytica]RDW52249.1 hypothetical protein B0I75DRAFT_152633 [Yarrowia lipolytica]
MEVLSLINEVDFRKTVLTHNPLLAREDTGSLLLVGEIPSNATMRLTPSPSKLHISYKDQRHSGGSHISFMDGNVNDDYKRFALKHIVFS